MERSIDILNELNTISPLVAGIKRQNVFTVPEGYFDTIAGSVLFSVQNEVPDGYFDMLSGNILSKIEGTAAHELQGLSPFMAGLKKTTPYQVPENYFENLSIESTGVNDTEHTPAVLEGLDKKPPFTMPAGYFEQLADSILDKVKATGGARVVTMPRRSKNIWKLAAAAVFTGLISLGIYQYNGTGTIKQPVYASMDDTKFNESINNLSEEDIIKYLEKNGSDADVATLTSGIEETALPDQEEYFTDESTLDNFLEDIKQKN